MVKKYYKGIDMPGETLGKAIFATGHGCNDPPIMVDWVDGQAEAYLSKEYDGERFEFLVWDMRREILIDILKFEKYDVDNLGMGEFTRDDLNKLIKKYKDGSLAVLLELKKRFEHDLENKRIDWANERAWEDHNSFMPGPKASDEEWAEFYGLDLEVEAFDINGNKIDCSDCYICPECEEACEISEADNFRKEYIDAELPYSFVCPNCFNEFPYNQDVFIESNKHLPKNVLIALKV